MKNAIKKHGIKLLALVMVLAAVGAAVTSLPAAAIGCSGGCTVYWAGGWVCLSPNQTYCYPGQNWLQICICDAYGHCSLQGAGVPCN